MSEGPWSRVAIDPGTNSETNSRDPKYHQYNMTVFSAVLAPETSNTTSVDIQQTETITTNNKKKIIDHGIIF